MLLIASYVFYGAWDWRFMSLILTSTVVDYWCGIGIGKTDDYTRKKAYVTLSIITNLTLLGIFKYYDFFALNFGALMGHFGLPVQPYFLNVALPIGISFYTFQTMSYTIDVYRNKLKPAQNFFDFALYVSFFPQLIAGPIERGTRLLPQILAPRTVNTEKIYRGVYYFIWGLFLKVFIADNLAKIVDPVFAAEGAQDGALVLIAVYAYSIQIYCDFAGYSFMAIGLAESMGITLMENFRRPYFSKNIGEFWRRWHISLSSWFRDYVFSPFYMYLEKKKTFQKYPLVLRHGIAFFTTLFVTEYMLGLWHGAGWNFGFFGIYHALMIWAYYYTRHYWDRMNRFVQIFLTYNLACGGWLIFRSSTLGQAGDMFHDILFNFSTSPSEEVLSAATQLASLAAILLIIQLLQDWKNDTLVIMRLPQFAQYAFLVLLVSLTAILGDFGARPFIYFQF